MYLHAAISSMLKKESFFLERNKNDIQKKEV